MYTHACVGVSCLMKPMITLLIWKNCIVTLLLKRKSKMPSIHVTFRAGIVFLIIMLSSCGGFFRYCYTGYRPQIIVHQITNYVPLPTDRSCPEERQGLVVSKVYTDFFLILKYWMFFLQLFLLKCMKDWVTNVPRDPHCWLPGIIVTSWKCDAFFCDTQIMCGI
jgi:hypothetical protein